MQIEQIPAQNYIGQDNVMIENISHPSMSHLSSGHPNINNNQIVNATMAQVIQRNQELMVDDQSHIV